MRHIARPGIIYLVPLDAGDLERLEPISESIGEQFALPVEILDDFGPPAYALDAARNQFNAQLILKYLSTIAPPDTLKILGITSHDLFNPIFSFVFGEAQFGGRCAVLSTFRLRGGPARGRQAGCLPLLHRVEKEAIHELGHTFGLRHCSDPDCVMHYSAGVECADRKFSYFCAACRELMLWHLATQVFLGT